MTRPYRHMDLSSEQRVVSIYRMGRETASDTQYWLAMPITVDFTATLLSVDPKDRAYGSPTEVSSAAAPVSGQATATEPQEAPEPSVPESEKSSTDRGDSSL